MTIPYALEAIQWPDIHADPGRVEAVVSALNEVADERARQDAQWGGPAHDDGHGPSDWRGLLGEHVGRLVVVHGQASADYRERLVKIAAIAVAAVEAHDRAGGRMEP